MEYGLIGATLKHSYSKLIHEQLYPCDYQLTELPTEAGAREFMEKRPFKAINVTIPYKQLVIPYCAVLDEKAKLVDLFYETYAESVANGTTTTNGMPGR